MTVSVWWFWACWAAGIAIGCVVGWWACWQFYIGYDRAQAAKPFFEVEAEAINSGSYSVPHIDYAAMFTKANAEKLAAQRMSVQYKKLYDELAATRPASQFEKHEVDSLIRLCHPDKHAGKEVAHRLTQKLLAMRT